MIFFFKSDGTLIKSAPETVYQGSAEAGKVYVVAPLNANMLVDVYYELPNGERWGAYLLENNGTVINNEELPDGWALWSTTLESAITQYAGTLKAQFGFYQSGTADKVPLITSQGVTITIAKGVVRDLPSAPTADVYAQIVNAISSIKQDIANLPNEYLSNTNEDKIALKNNGAVEYSENSTAGTIVKRDRDGKINVADGTEDLNAVNLGQFNAALANKVSSSSVSATAVKDTIAQRTATGQLKAADGVADDDLATVKQLNAVQGNYTDITNIDLNTGDTTVEYDTELGIKVNAKGTVTHKNGSTEQPTTKFELPIIAGAGVSIDKKENKEKVEIKSDINLEKGIDDVLVQTNDTNHSFKVMTDGRAKVKSAPTEADDVVRKKELDSALTSVYTYKGSKDTYANLPATGNNVGDVWNVEDTGTNYAWNGTNWDSLSANVLDSTGNSTVQGMSQKATTDELNKKVNTSENFVKVFTIPNGVSTGTLTADVKQKLCNPDGHNYYVFDDTSEMILKYSFNEDDEIIQYKAIYLLNDKAYDITMQILPSNGSWRRSQTILNSATANPTLTGTEAELTGLKVGGTNYKIPVTKEYVDDNAVLRQLEEITDTSANAFKTLKSGLYKINSKATSGFPNNLPEGYYTVTVHHYGELECTIFVQTVNKPDCYVAYIGNIAGVNGFYNIATIDYVDNGFVKKVNRHNTVYATDSTGKDTDIGYSQSPYNSAITQYTSSGTVRTNTPTYELDAANKKYVDDKITELVKLYQHNYTFEAGTNNYVYCTTYKNSKTPMTKAEVINFFKSDPSVGKVVNVCVVDDEIPVGSGCFFDAGEGIDYTVIVLNSSANFIINADTNMTTNIIEL